MSIKKGDKIPELLGADQNGNQIKASDFAGEKLALYFYPKDNTPGCTAQACSLRDGYSDLKKAGYAIVGVSVDSGVSHRKFIEKFSLPFPLIADTEKKTGRAIRRVAGEEKLWENLYGNHSNNISYR